jgi:hypothetical protein
MTTMTRRGALPGAMAAAVMAGRKARVGTPVRFGVLADMGGPLFIHESFIHGLKTAMDIGPNAVNADGQAITARMMMQIRAGDPTFGPGHIRQGGCRIHNMFLFQVKVPAESHKPRDDDRQLADTPAEQALRPKPEGHCVMVKT